MKINKVFLTTLLLGVIVLAPQPSLAARLAPSDSKVPRNEPLQPIPTHVAPNLSGNVNASENDITAPQPGSEDVEEVTPEDNIEATPNPESGQEPQNEKSNSVLPFIILILALIIAAVTVFAVIHKNRKQSL
jgi:hypothetical protein